MYRSTLLVQFPLLPMIGKVGWCQLLVGCLQIIVYQQKRDRDTQAEWALNCYIFKMSMIVNDRRCHL